MYVEGFKVDEKERTDRRQCLMTLELQHKLFLSDYLQYGTYSAIIYSATTPSGETIHFEIELGFLFFSIQIGEEEEGLSATVLEVYRYEGRRGFSTECPYRCYVLVRGLYCLGWECCDFNLSSFSILSQMASALTAHEKLELRLSMPREFWPQKWLDEEPK